MSLDFLRRDCSIMRDFFERKLERVLTIQATFDFVTDISITNDTEEDVMQTLLENLADQTIAEYEEALAKDAVFKEMYIPRTLQEVSIEDIIRMQRDGVEIAFDKLTGLKLDKQPVNLAAQEEAKTEETKEGNEEIKAAAKSSSSGAASD